MRNILVFISALFFISYEMHASDSSNCVPENFGDFRKFTCKMIEEPDSAKKLLDSMEKSIVERIDECSNSVYHRMAPGVLVYATIDKAPQEAREIKAADLLDELNNIFTLSDFKIWASKAKALSVEEAIAFNFGVSEITCKSEHALKWACGFSIAMSASCNQSTSQ